MERLRRLRYLLIDMDGVLYRGGVPLPGATDFLEWLKEREIRYLFVTNNSTRTPEQYAERLSRIGIPAEPREILTSALATRAFLQERAPRGTPVYLIGQEGLSSALFGDGHFLFDDQSPRFVVVGLDTHLTYEKLKRATLLIRAGATFIGTNPDRTFPSPEGITPGCGAILAAIEAATDVRPLIIGKPERWLFEAALQRLGATPEESGILGDRLDTDIAGGKRVGLKTLLVLTGVHGPKDLEASIVQPDAVYPDLPTLMRAWEEPTGTLDGKGAHE
ncbi:MAG: HAD-IIA family hydrolase [Chloroflexia bacterium]